MYTVFQKSDAKIEITITTTHLIRIKYPLSSCNYRLSGANVANFNRIHHTVFEKQLFKNGTQKQKFPIWKSRLSSTYTIPSVTVCAQSGRHLHRQLHVSCADRTFSAAAGLPVCRRCSVNLPQKSVQCWTRPLLVTKFLQQLSGIVTLTLSYNFLISIPSFLVKTIALYVNQTRHRNVTNITPLFVTLPAVRMLIGIFHVGKFCF